MLPHDFALLAQEAYSAAPDIGKADSASRAIVRQTEAGLVVAFRGSDDVDSWVHNLDVQGALLSGVGDVHRGFLTAWQAIEPAAVKAVGDQPVTLVGHSLGSAIAILAACTMKRAGKPPIAVYAFEPPRVSPGLCVREYLADVPMYLYRNGLDIVTQVPLGWQQSGLLTRIGTPLLPFPNIRDHSLDRIVAALPSGVPA